MEIEVKPVRRRSSWTLRMAMRAVLMGVMGVVAASVLQSVALPKIETESRGLGQKVIRTYLPAGVDRELAARPPMSIAGVRITFMTVIPAVAALLGIAALLLRPARAILAPIAMLVAVGAFVFIVVSLISAMAPLYQIPPELR